MNLLTYRPRLKKDLKSQILFRNQDSNINAATEWNLRLNLQLIRDPLCFQNLCLNPFDLPKNPQSNPSIQKTYLFPLHKKEPELYAPLKMFLLHCSNYLFKDKISVD